MRIPLAASRALARSVKPSTSHLSRRTHITDPQNLGCTPMSPTPAPAGPIENAIRERVS
jgi:hypothetical protein